jgi:hypothetical protein
VVASGSSETRFDRTRRHSISSPPKDRRQRSRIGANRKRDKQSDQEKRMRFSLKYTATDAVYMSMRKFILSLTALASLTMASVPAFAHLGDTYAQSCTRFGGKGTVDKQSKRIVWYLADSHMYIGEYFVKNRCAALLVAAEPGYPLSVDGVEKTILSNGLWKPNPAGVLDTNIAEWVSKDGTCMAILTNDGRLSVAYRWYMERKGLLKDAPDYGPAPVEDTLGDTDGTNT